MVIVEVLISGCFPRRPVPSASEDEERRFVLLGMSLGTKTLVVCHCCSEEDQVIRLFSARKANKSERRDYDRRWR